MWGIKVILVSVVIFGQWSSCLGTGFSDNEIRKGPNPEPSSKSQTNNFRSRFPLNFQKDSKLKSGGVKILESLSRSSSNVLGRNPSLIGNPGNPGSSSRNSGNPGAPGGNQDLPLVQKRQGDYDEDEFLDSETEELDSNSVGSYSPMPVFPNTPRPTVLSYKPGLTPGPGLVFPPVTMEPPPGVISPPMSTFAPIGPPGPSGTIVPIIGGNGGNGGGDLAPAPPEDIFPPGPPEIESVGRSLNLRTASPRTRISNVGPTQGPRDVIPVRRAGSNGTPGSKSGGGSSGSGSPGSPGRSSGGSGSGSPGAPGRNGGGNGANKRVRLRDKVRASIESVNEDEVSNETDVGSDPNVITDFVFSDIRCFKTRSKEYFGATIHMKNGYHIPYVRDRPQDPLTSNECRMDKVPGSVDTFHMTVTDLRGCGVEQCGDYMCLTMVFPRVPTLALADDEVTTIKCLPQKSTMADTRTISFAGDSLENRRSSSTVEGGGQDFAAEVGVFRQNPGSSNGLYVKRVNSGGVVQLGENLQLRSIVRGGDGWKHSRLSDVKVWRMRDASSSGNLDNLDPNDASEVITLVDGRGCRNDEYMVIADSHPLKDPRNELVNHFTFKAFLFRGQRANEPLVLTAKVHACQEDLDCNPESCSSVLSRSKRAPTEIRNASAIIHDWDSRMALRVVGLKDHSASLTEQDFPLEYSGQWRNSSNAPLTCAEKMGAAGLGGAFIALFLCGIALALYAYVIKGKASRVKSVPFSTAFVENGRRNPTMPKGQEGQRGFMPDTIRGKPLPLPPSSSNDTTTKSKLAKSEISNVAKLLQKLADKNDKSQGSQEQTQYECIDESSSTSGSMGSSDTNDNITPGKKSDGVYIVYCCKEKGKRPKSAPPTLRGKRGKGRTSKGIYEEPPTEDSVSGSQESEDSSEDMTNNSSHCGVRSGGSGRRTVRNVKNRSNHHHNNSSKQKVLVSGIRRRLSSFYKDGRMTAFKTNVMSGGQNKSGSFPARQRTRSSRGHTARRRGQLSDDIYSSTQLSSDLDSAYYGSEFNDDGSRYELQQQQLRQYDHYDNFNVDRNRNGHRETPRHGKDRVLNDIKMQLRSAAGKVGGGPRDVGAGVNRVILGPGSPPLEPGHTKATHFVTRNESSTQILIVPETHV